jgi:hypothetical protein
MTTPHLFPHACALALVLSAACNGAGTTEQARDVGAGETAAAPPGDGSGGSSESGAIATTGANATAAPVPGAPIDDSMVTSLIQARYFLDPAIKVRTIDVASANGVVTLRGQVASDDERAKALLLARTTRGVERSGPSPSRARPKASCRWSIGSALPGRSRAITRAGGLEARPV